MHLVNVSEGGACIARFTRNAELVPDVADVTILTAGNLTRHFSASFTFAISLILTKGLISE